MKGHKREPEEASLLPASLHLLRRNPHLPWRKKKYKYPEVCERGKVENTLHGAARAAEPGPAGHPHATGRCPTLATRC